MQTATSGNFDVLYPDAYFQVLRYTPFVELKNVRGSDIADGTSIKAKLLYHPFTDAGQIYETIFFNNVARFYFDIDFSKMTGYWAPRDSVMIRFGWNGYPATTTDYTAYTYTWENMRGWADDITKFLPKCSAYLQFTNSSGNVQTVNPVTIAEVIYTSSKGGEYYVPVTSPTKNELLFKRTIRTPSVQIRITAPVTSFADTNVGELAASPYVVINTDTSIGLFPVEVASVTTRRNLINPKTVDYDITVTISDVNLDNITGWI